MSSTTGNRRVPFSRILLISIAVQALGLVGFYAFEPLRKSRLTSEQRDVEELNREARERLKEVERERAERRKNIELKPDNAKKLVEEREREKAREIAKKIEDMKVIRDKLAAEEQFQTEALSERTIGDVSMNLFLQLHPLATQLVENAAVQRKSSPLPAAPGTETSANVLLRFIEQQKASLLEPHTFESLKSAHASVRAAQHEYILQLDEAQAGYPDDHERIRRENHIEYLVNLKRDQIGRLLGLTEALNPETMNEVPAEYAVPPPLPDDWSESLDGQSVAELHQAAQQLFSDIQTLYTGARAAELALARLTSMADAMESVEPPGAPSSFDPGGMPGMPGTVGELNEYAGALGQAARDVRRMWEASRNMGGAGDRGTPSSPEGFAEARAVPPGQGGRGASRAVAGAAARGMGGRFADMTGFMYHSGHGEKGYASGHGGGRDITRESIRSGYVETGAGTPGAEPPLLSEDKVLAQALPGRKFSRESDRTGWLYMDTWYVIGPWENNSRITFENTHPPETLIDLDAEYTGKDGLPLRWAFHQSDNIRIKPPNEMESATYYGYTEVFFEEETEMLVAVASDDAAKVWLNDVLIWEDGGLGPWRLDEGFRRVVFREGFNEILLRIENGPVTCTFSLMLCPPDVLAAR